MSKTNLIENKKKILIIDFGSQVTKLIARRIRELHVYCEIINIKKFNTNINQLLCKKTQGRKLKNSFVFFLIKKECSILSVLLV